MEKSKKRRIALAVCMGIVAVGAVITAGVFTVQSRAQAAAAKRDLQYSYSRALADLRDCVDNVGLTLEKSIYANTPTQQNGLAARLMRECSLAKGSLAVLPVSAGTLDSVSKYISQVGDFSMSLSQRISAGGSIQEGEYRTMAQLRSYAQRLRKSLRAVKPDFSAPLDAQFQEAAEDFTDFPSLIYDGPFSDHIGRQSPRLLQGKEQLPLGNAQNVAAAFLGVQAGQLQHTGDSNGGLPSYNFSAGSRRLSVTKVGCLPYAYSDSRDIVAENVEPADAQKRAQAFLAAKGYPHMEPTYWAQADGHILFNFAYSANGVRCYPDLIKVGVALDNGGIVSFDATGYVMNHKDRERLAQPKRSEAQARKKLSPRLQVQAVRPALIPTEGLREVLCWEFACRGAGEDQVLVYSNGETGLEEQILILQPTDLGTFAK